MGNRKLLRRIEPEAIWNKGEGEDREFFYHKSRSGSRRNYSYKVTFLYGLWKEVLKENGITWEDIKNGRLRIEEFAKDNSGFGQTKFVKV